MIRFARIVLRSVLAVAVAGAGLAFGQAGPDPTRPPKNLSPTQVQRAGAVADARQSEAAGPELQSVIIGPSARYAIIEGQIVGVGDRLNDARVIAVTPTHVVLRSERGVQTVKLFPDIEKRPSKPTLFESDKGGATRKRSIRLGESEGNVAKGRK